VQEAVDEYEKNELVRQSLNYVKQNADKQRAIREGRDLSYSATKSRVRGNVKSIERAKKHSVSPQKKFVPEHTLIEELGLEKSIEVSGHTIRVVGEMSPVRLQKDPAYQELRRQMEDNIELTEQYKVLRSEYEQTRRQKIHEGSIYADSLREKYSVANQIN
jgi:hypothetical protein